jgi:hypothetical protein
LILLFGLRKQVPGEDRINVYIHEFSIEGRLFAGQLVLSTLNSEAFDQTQQRHQGDEEFGDDVETIESERPRSRGKRFSGTGQICLQDQKSK